MGVMMAGALLGPRKGVLAVLTVIALGLVGLPVLAGGRTALFSLSSPTAGFLIGWIPTAFVIGWLTAKMLPKYRIIAGIGINLLGGVVILYAFGIVGMMVRGHMSFVAAWSANAASFLSTRQRPWSPRSSRPRSIAHIRHSCVIR